MVDLSKRRCLKTAKAWRAWLRKHHATEQELWLVLYKKHTGKADLVYEEAVCEALCFGWIDGIRKRIDDEKHMIRFTPRRPNSRWSPTNKRRVAELIADGRMTEVGLAKVEEAKRNGQWDHADVPRPVPEVPVELTQALARNKAAQRRFEALAPSYRKQFIWWIASAKRDVTRSKRVAEAVQLLAQNKKLGMK
ncbi:MAG: YdeI/OmpD-associated family protein [Phycisphaerales bacterium]|nr:MAG: YdeI/OmpD-associated family protein [Phycisphaerales bacterium]